jgi:hypothetical protein
VSRPSRPSRAISPTSTCPASDTFLLGHESHRRRSGFGVSADSRESRLGDADGPLVPPDPPGTRCCVDRRSAG